MTGKGAITGGAKRKGGKNRKDLTIFFHYPVVEKRFHGGVSYATVTQSRQELIKNLITWLLLLY